MVKWGPMGIRVSVWMLLWKAVVRALKCQATQVCRWGQAVAFALVRVGVVDDAGGGEPEGWVGEILKYPAFDAHLVLCDRVCSAICW